MFFGPVEAWLIAGSTSISASSCEAETLTLSPFWSVVRTKILASREAVGRQVVVGERVLHVRVVEEDHGPGAPDEAARAHQLRGRAPHRREMPSDELLQRAEEPVEIDAERDGGLAEAGHGRDLALVEGAADEAVHRRHGISPGVTFTITVLPARTRSGRGRKKPSHDIQYLLS